MLGLPKADSHAVCVKYMPTFQGSMASAATLEYSAMTNLVSAWTVVLSSSLADSARAIFVLHLVAVIDPRSKVESRYHAGQVKQPKQRCQWTGDTLVSALSQSIMRRLLMLMPYLLLLAVLTMEMHCSTTISSSVGQMRLLLAAFISRKSVSDQVVGY